ncbi:uncharacterized protein LOC122066995 [Macadamia integrifolia]|uniref:uncharacterized protein LOC122066995 n=1 Tax=Macadamia integrifolia TaxID=60698 RepID=UPI001C4EBFF3|nr:uncharacterized protein LOC122066995 [Macadamia integrifolia]
MAFLEFHSAAIVPNSSPVTSSTINTSEYGKWEAPPRGFVKANYDAAHPQGGISGGLGIIYRKHDGHLHKALSIPQPFASAIQGEALAIRTTLSQALGYGYTHLLIELDCKEIIDYIQDPRSFPPGEVAVVIEDVHKLCSSFASIFFHFIPRAINSIADALPRKALSIMCRTNWPITTPWLQDLCVDEAIGCTHGYFHQ